jgi:tight adherence protein B
MVCWGVVGMETAIILISTFLIFSMLIYLFLRIYLNRKRMNNRMKEFLPLPEAKEAIQELEKKPNFSNRFVNSVASVFKSVQFSESTEKILLEAGSKLRPEELFAARLLTAVSSGIFTLFLGLPWYFVIIVVLIGFSIPKLSIKRKRKKRLAVVNYQLIEVLGMMANSMRAGFSFMQAMQLVGKEMPDPLGPEFERLVRQAGLGIPLEEALEELVERLPNKELEVVVRGILAQRRSGGNLAQLLETMEETIRGRVRILEELNTLTAQGRMSSWIITLLPVALGLYLALMNKEYFSPMLEHPLGWMMLLVGSVSIIIGWAFIQKIIRIEV